MIRATFTIFLLLSSIMAQATTPYRVLTIGDSHSTVEGAFGESLAEARKTLVEHHRIAVLGTTLFHLETGFTGYGPFAKKLKSIKDLNPDLILLAFGTNEAIDWDETMARHWPKSLKTVLAKLKTEAPNAEIVILGPPDTTVAKLKLSPIIDLEAKSANSLSLRWIDRRNLMRSWAKGETPMFHPDGVHLSAAGYARLAKDVAIELSQAKR